MSIITLDDFEGRTPAAFVAHAIENHMGSELYQNALIANDYYRQRNTTISKFSKIVFNVNGTAQIHNGSNLKLASNFYKHLIVSRVLYSLGKGVSFIGDSESGEDKTKEFVGSRFDSDMVRAGLNAVKHGVTFAFWNLDHVDLFAVDQFAPVWDAHSGALVAGVRFWQVDPNKPKWAVLYEQDGYTTFKADSGQDYVIVDKKAPYVQKVSVVPADGIAEVVECESYSSLPIIPIWGNDEKQAAIVGLRSHIDAYDLIKSGLCNDVYDCAEVYWLVENAGGMNDKELQKFLDRIRRNHVAEVNTDDGTTVKPYTQEVPTGSRTETLRQIRNDIYEDFGALDVHTIAAGSTNDHIDAAYQPVDHEAAELERIIGNAISDILALAGIEDTPVFTRDKISNVKEQVEIILLEAEYLDEETILRKLPNISPAEVQRILETKDEDAANRYGVE